MSVVASTGSKKSVDSAHAHSQAGSGYGYRYQGYGYQGKLNRVIKTEFPQLQGKVYADHAGATLYTKSQIEALKQVCSTAYRKLLLQGTPQVGGQATTCLLIPCKSKWCILSSLFVDSAWSSPSAA